MYETPSMPSPLIRISLARLACMAPKNIVLAAPPGLRTSGAGAGAGAGAPDETGRPQLPQKRCCGATSALQYGQRLAPALGVDCEPRAGTMPSDAPQTWHVVALSGLNASQESHTSPRVMRAIVAEPGPASIAGGGQMGERELRGAAHLRVGVGGEAGERGARLRGAGRAERGGDGGAHLGRFVGDVLRERRDAVFARRAERARGGLAHEAARVVERRRQRRA